MNLYGAPLRFVALFLAALPNCWAFVVPLSHRSKINAISTSQPTNVRVSSFFLSSITHDKGHGTVHKSYYSFEEMKDLETRLDALQKEAPELLSGFYEPHLKSFSVRPGAATVSSFILYNMTSKNSRTDILPSL
jgi:hypothetical protein